MQNGQQAHDMKMMDTGRSEIQEKLRTAGRGRLQFLAGRIRSPPPRVSGRLDALAGTLPRRRLRGIAGAP
eukprot:14251503-Alexandrium_andersonii.AAC.1